jgi:hypothetical protein
MHPWREDGNTYLRICVSAYLGDKKITKNQEKSRKNLKKNVPAGTNAYLRICYFLKKSQPESMILSAGGTESMMLSDTLSRQR